MRLRVPTSFLRSSSSIAAPFLLLVGGMTLAVLIAHFDTKSAPIPHQAAPTVQLVPEPTALPSPSIPLVQAPKPPVVNAPASSVATIAPIHTSSNASAAIARSVAARGTTQSATVPSPQPTPASPKVVSPETSQTVHSDTLLSINIRTTSISLGL